MRRIKNLRVVLIFTLFLLYCCFAVLIANAASLLSPTDIEGHWAAKQILDWTSKSSVGVYSDGTFKPDNNITRAEFIALVNWAFGYTKTSPLSFSDVSENDSYAADIARAVTVGYMGGYPDGTMKPHNPLTRQEAAAILMKILHPVNTGSTLTFIDEIPQWCAATIDAVVSNGYMSGYPDKTFRPTNMITRAEAISLIARAMGTLYNQAGNYGSAEETTTISGHVTISQSGVALKNTIIAGNLYLTEGIGDGHVTLENVQVKGTTQVSGGGENSIIVLNSILGRVLIDVPDNSKVRVDIQGSTINSLVIQSMATVTGQGKIQAATINVPGVIIETKPITVTLAEGVEAIIAGQMVRNEAELAISGGEVAFFGGGGGSTEEAVEDTDAEDSAGDARIFSGGGGGGGGGFGGTSTRNNAPTVVAGNATQTGTATPAAVGGDPAVVEYSADVSAWFTDADDEDTLTYAVVSALDEAENDLRTQVIIDGTLLKYAPAAAQAAKAVTIVVKANDSKADSSGNVTITVNVTAVPQATPTFEPAAGAIAFGTTVTISSVGADAIYYTTDGSDPTTEATEQATTPLVINAPVTVKALAVKEGMPDSTIVSAVYTQAETADLSGLALSGDPADYLFAGNTYTYEGVRVASGVESITVTPTGTGEITVTADEVTETVPSGTASGAIMLEIGVEKTIVVVATEAGKAAKTYTIKVTRAEADVNKVPRNLVAEAGAQAISLTWDAVPEATEYQVYRSTESGTGYVKIADIIGPTTTYNSTGLAVGRRYYYKVTAIVGSVESDFSAEATAVANLDGEGTEYWGDWLLVSNESTDTGSTQATGALSMTKDSLGLPMMTTNTLPGETALDVFRLNPVLPYEPGKAENLPKRNLLLSVPQPSMVGDTRIFNVYNFATGGNATIPASLAYIGSKAEVWVGCITTVDFTDDMARQIGAEFDSSIYPLVCENFYTESDVNGDGKIAILCYDIEDTYTGPGTAYVGGYFWGGDLSSASHSNQMEIFYLDTYPTMGTDENNPDVTKVYSTLAHEFQHMVNFNRDMEETVAGTERAMATWLNEALSMAAEHLYNGVQSGRISYYNTSEAIRDGRSLLKWDDFDDSVLANYSLSYLFAQYLRTQVEQVLSEGSEVKLFREIIEDTAGDYVAVENVIRKYIDPVMTFGEFLTNFRTAMLLKADSGYYGFGGEAAFDSLNTPLYTEGATTLYGGGAVVKLLSSAPFSDINPADQGADVQYRGVFQP